MGWSDSSIDILLKEVGRRSTYQLFGNSIIVNVVEECIVDNIIKLFKQLK